jgi:hypothetical protein
MQCQEGPWNEAGHFAGRRNFQVLRTSKVAAGASVTRGGLDLRVNSNKRKICKINVVTDKVPVPVD